MKCNFLSKKKKNEFHIIQNDTKITLKKTLTFLDNVIAAISDLFP